MAAAQDTVVNSYHAVTQASAGGGSTLLELDAVGGLAAGDVVMVVQSSDDRGSAGVRTKKPRTKNTPPALTRHSISQAPQPPLLP